MRFPKVHVNSGILDDIRGRAVWYRDDWKQGLNCSYRSATASTSRGTFAVSTVATGCVVISSVCSSTGLGNGNMRFKWRSGWMPPAATGVACHCQSCMYTMLCMLVETAVRLAGSLRPPHTSCSLQPYQPLHLASNLCNTQVM